MPNEPSRGAGGWFATFTMVLNVIGTLLILVMGVAVNVDIIGRNVFNEPVPGVTEFVGLSIVAVVFLQMANTLREDRHISNDLIFKAIGASHPVVAHAFYALFHVIGAILMALILWFVWPILVDNYEGDYYKGTAGVIEIPVWPCMAVVVVGAAASVVQYMLCAWAEVRRAMTAASPA